MCRRRFSPNAVASVCNGHVRISHDRRANTTGRTPYMFCGDPVIITDNNVFRNGNWIGNLFIDDHGQKYVLGPHNKGYIETIPSSL
jgi:hypothetical protein